MKKVCFLFLFFLLNCGSESTVLPDESEHELDVQFNVSLSSLNSKKAINVSASVEGHHVCAVFEGGSLKCWGKNDFGQLGQGDSRSRGTTPEDMGVNLKPIDLGKNKKARAVSVGLAHTCVLLTDGKVKCFGNNSGAQLGLGDQRSRGALASDMGDKLPSVFLGAGTRVSQLQSASTHNCVLFSGLVKCFGNPGQTGKLGYTENIVGDRPGEMGGNLEQVSLSLFGLKSKTISARAHHSCALLSDGSIKCWGFNGQGQLGLGDMLSRGVHKVQMAENLPTVKLGKLKAIDVATGLSHSCAILENQNLKCWGSNDFGQLGQGDRKWRGYRPNQMGDALPVVNLGIDTKVKQVALGDYHSCALLTDGTVKCFGLNNQGQLGLGDAIDRGDDANELGDRLKAVDLGQKAIQITAGHHITCVLLSDGSIKCFGLNSQGQLGQGDTRSRGSLPGGMGTNLKPISF